MYPQERQESIAGLVAQRGRVSVSEVAETYGVTTETVRRDLGRLERAGVLRRVHGGAVPTASLTLVELGVAARDTAFAEQKDRIARAALQLLPPAGGSVVLDAGTTTGRLAQLLPGDRPLTVITNALPIATTLASTPSVGVQLLGGRVRGVTQAAVGEDAVRALRDLRVDVAFMGTNALDPDFGLSTPDADEAAVKRAMVGAAASVVVLADSSKIGRTYLVRFAALDQVDVVVTDSDVDADAVRELRAREIEVVVA